MSELFRPSQVAEQIAKVLDDNVHVPLEQLLQFERALGENPADRTLRLAYRDWLLEHGCIGRAEQLEEHEPAVYDGPLQPAVDTDWARL
jgi:uncharacterized protein (TIGR02996 family)